MAVRCWRRRAVVVFGYERRWLVLSAAERGKWMAAVVRETVGLRRRGMALLEVEGERLLLWSGLFVDPEREADGSAERGEESGEGRRWPCLLACGWRWAAAGRSSLLLADPAGVDAGAVAEGRKYWREKAGRRPVAEDEEEWCPGVAVWGLVAHW